MRFYFFLLTGLLLSAELHAGTPVVAAPSVSEKMMKDMHPVTLGEFSAGIKILDLKDLDAALTTPMEEIVAAHTEATKAKPDGRFVVFIAFSGMQLDDDRRADVTYELHLISPSGKADIIPSVIKPA